jgi:hypothetical protein
MTGKKEQGFSISCSTPSILLLLYILQYLYGEQELCKEEHRLSPLGFDLVSQLLSEHIWGV